MLDRFDLDRYWRIAVPVAWVGCVASLTWAAALAVFDLTDDAMAIDLVLFLGIVPLHVGTVVTGIRIGRPPRPDHSLPSWIGRSVLGGVFLFALLQWSDVWGGFDHDSMLSVVAALFYGGSIAMGRQYRRTTGASEPTGAATWPGARPTDPPPYLVGPPPTAAGPATAPPTGADGPWAMPVGTPAPPRPPVDVGQAVGRLLPVVVAAGVLFVFIARGGGTDAVVGPEDRPFYVATIVGGDRIETDGPSREPVDPPAALRAAACRNYRDFLDDRSLGTELAILDDPGLLRSAELLDGAWANDAVALDAETFLNQQGDVAGARARMADDEWPAADVDRAERYYAARALPPTAGAADRYVVYATSHTTSRRLVVRLAIDPSAETFREPRSTRVGDIEIRMPDGSVMVVDDSSCWE